MMSRYELFCRIVAHLTLVLDMRNDPIAGPEVLTKLALVPPVHIETMEMAVSNLARQFVHWHTNRLISQPDWIRRMEGEMEPARNIFDLQRQAGQAG